MIDKIGTDVSSRPGTVLDNDGLAPFAREPIPDQPRDGIGRPAGGEGHNDFYGTVRIVVGTRRTGDERRERERKRQRDHGSARNNQWPSACAAHQMPFPNIPAGLTAP